MSTAPGAVGGGRGHWMQSVQFLPRPVPVACPCKGVGQGESPGCGGGVDPGLESDVGRAYRLRAKYLVDRVLLDLEQAPVQGQ